MSLPDPSIHCENQPENQKTLQHLSTPPQQTILTIALLIALYAMLAMFDNFKGIFVPYFKQDFAISNAQVGVLMTSSLLAYAVFQYICGMLVERFGHKRVVSSGIVVAILALLLIVNARSFPLLLLGFFALNIGSATFNVAVNTLGPMVQVASTATLMNIINFSYGTSNTISQKAVGQLLARGVRWPSFFVFLIAAAALLFIFLLLIRLPQYHQEHKVIYSKKDLFKNKFLYLYIVAIGFYLAAEYGTGNWFVNYMSDTYQLGADLRSTYVALFFGLETVGRLFGGVVIDRLGYYRSILVCGLGAFALTLAGILMGRSGLLIFALAGLGYSIIYPTIMLAFYHVFKEAAVYATGLLLMSGTLLAMLVNLIIGIANDYLGSRLAFYAIALCLAIFLAAVWQIWQSSRKTHTSI
ncbi:MAG: MFS transporter [Clostridia bacterium]|nr:MFS transporter [Clostridia bacterium]